MDATPLPFTLRQVQYALAVAETRNFRRAAERCAVAQPSLSAQVAGLERALDVVLFERGRGGVRVTPPGEVLLARMEELVLEAAELARQARTLTDPLAGTLRLGIIPTLAPYVLPFLVPALQAAFPRLQPLWTEIRTPDLVAALEAGKLDGGLLAREADLGTLERRPLGKDPFLVCLPARHPLARGRRPIPMDALEGERILLLEEGHCLRDQALAACSRTRVEELGFRATSLPTLVQMVGNGLGVTLLPALAVATETARAPVVVRPIQAPVPYRTLALAWRRGSYAEPAFRRLEKVLARAVREHAGA
jgi:LysR family transcriptional regulator, hydrogen peroxide-inducible genes activator